MIEPPRMGINRDEVDEVSPKKRTESIHSTTRSIKSCSSRLLGETPSITGIPEQGNRGVASIAIILFKTITGAGALAMPKAMSDSGVILFPIMVIVISLMSHYGCYLLSKSLDIVGREDVDIAGLGSHCLGRYGFCFAMAICFFDSWGAALGSLRMIADLIQPILKDRVHHLRHSTLASEWFIIIVLSIIVFPMMLYRNITQLGWINLLGVLSMMVFVVCIFVKVIYEEGDFSGTETAEFNANSMLAIPIVFFSYDCQTNVFGSYRDLSGEVGNKTGKLSIASLVANVSAGVSYILIAFCGYLTYKDNVEDDVLNNFSSDFDAIKILFALSVLLSFPVILIECSTILQQHVMYKLIKSGGDEDEDEEDQLVDHFINASTNLFIIISAGLVAAFVPSMYSAFAYVGATTATSNTAIIPPLFYLATVRRHYPNQSIFCFKQLQQDDCESQHFLESVSSQQTDALCPPPPTFLPQILALLYLVFGGCLCPFLLYITAKYS